MSVLVRERTLPIPSSRSIEQPRNRDNIEGIWHQVHVGGSENEPTPCWFPECGDERKTRPGGYYNITDGDVILMPKSFCDKVRIYEHRSEHNG